MIDGTRTPYEVVDQFLHKEHETKHGEPLTLEELTIRIEQTAREFNSMVKDLLAAVTKKRVVDPGETFGVGWNRNGSYGARVGGEGMPERKDLGSIHTEMKHYPYDGHEFEISLAEGGITVIKNTGSKDILLSASNFPDGTKPNDMKDGWFIIKPGTSSDHVNWVNLNQAGEKYQIAWESNSTPSGRVSFEVRNMREYSTGEDSIELLDTTV